MNLLAFVVLVMCITVAVCAFAIPEDVWTALADRIRNPPRRPSYLEELHRHWEEEDRLRRWPNHDRGER